MRSVHLALLDRLPPTHSPNSILNFLNLKCSCLSWLFVPLGKKSRDGLLIRRHHSLIRHRWNTQCATPFDQNAKKKIEVFDVVHRYHLACRLLLCGYLNHSPNWKAPQIIQKYTFHKVSTFICNRLVRRDFRRNVRRRNWNTTNGMFCFDWGMGVGPLYACARSENTMTSVCV